MNPIPRKFYSRDTTRVAMDLLGKRLVRHIGGQLLSGTITETEAYGHLQDPASHAHRRMTHRNRAMFGEVGRAYVYFTYGMHYCFNVVSKSPDQAAGAVLIRAIQPHAGIETMMANRNKNTIKNLTDGPAKLSQALDITAQQYGLDLTLQGPLCIFDAPSVNLGSIVSGPRVGVRDTREWNFKVQLPGHPHHQ